MNPLGYEEAAAVRVVRPYLIEVTFRDGTKREIDMEGELWGQVFEPLRDPALFAQAAVDPLGGSVNWPTGADLAPEFLYWGNDGSPAWSGEPIGLEAHAEAPPEPR